MKLRLENIKMQDWQQAVNAAQDWHKWHNKEGHQKHKTIMQGKFVIHETPTGIIVVNYKT